MAKLSETLKQWIGYDVIITFRDGSEYCCDEEICEVLYEVGDDYIALRSAEKSKYTRPEYYLLDDIRTVHVTNEDGPLEIEE